jgi:hypothetical protein
MINVDSVKTKIYTGGIVYLQHLTKTDQYINLREVSLSIGLGQGDYVVIPSTFNRGEEGEFLLRYLYPYTSVSHPDSQLIGRLDPDPHSECGSGSRSSIRKKKTLPKDR